MTDPVQDAHAASGTKAARLDVDDPGLLADIFNSLPGRAILIDTDLVYRMVNQQFLDFVGKPMDEVLHKHAADVVGQAVVDTYIPLIGKVIEGETIRREGWADYPTRGRRYIQETISPYRKHNSGPVVGILLIVRDMTDQKNNEMQLVEQVQARSEDDALHRAVVSTGLDCIIIVNADGHVIEFNPAAERLFGYTAQEAMGREISELIVPEKYREAHRIGMARYMATGIARVIGKRVEMEARTKNGAIIPVEVALADVSMNAARYFTAHIRDLTGQKKAEAEIAHQRESIYQKEKLAALGSLLSGVAHELNNPLSIVIGQSMMLRELVTGQIGGPISADTLADRAMKIETAANRCAKIVKTFLAMARQRKAERTHVRVADVINGAVELLGYGLKTTGVTLSFDLADNVPGTSADADLLHQVMVNLIVNARQALEDTAEQERHITLSARHEPADNVIEIRVRDNGPGVKETIRNRIFDPFFTTKMQDHGTGIGLAVSRGLIEAHGGTLTLSDPQPERGAEFLIRLPVQIPEQQAAPANEAPRIEEPDEPGEEIVLVVDDEPEIGELIADMAQDFGYQTRVVVNGNAAVRLLLDRSLPITAILCDIRMPHGDGPSLYDWLSAHRQDLVKRIGFVTGDTLGPSAGRFLARTGCPVIEKPFSPDDIERVLETLTTGNN